jgi:E3 ubiquitin-protein ligase HECTD1
LVAVEFFGTLPEPLASRVTAIEDRLERAVLKQRLLLKEASPLDGIISYLTRKHGGNVADNRIVTITSKSVGPDLEFSLENVAYLALSYSEFRSQDEPGQWICWDFGELRVRPTHYTIRAYSLKSWVVEGSLDGSSWTEIDRQTDNQDFKDHANTASFAVSNPSDFRFIRLTQTDKNHMGADDLYLVAVEFFGILVE